MSALRIFYSPAYVAQDLSRLRRLTLAAAQLERQGLADVHAPDPIDPERLRQLHSARYVQDFMDGTNPLASSQGVRWTLEARDSALAMLGGQLEAARHALEHGLAMNMACGFHHAAPDHGGGFCAFNGLALIAQQYPGKRIFVLDCDEHGGNGTEAFTALLPNLYNVSIFGTRFGCLGAERSWGFQVRTAEQGFDAYVQALESAEELVRVHRPDLVLYQAGVDCHQDDPKATVGLTTQQLFERDLRVFCMTRRLQVPVLFVAAGGYQSAEKSAQLHINTVRAALDVYFSDSEVCASIAERVATL